MPYLEIESGPSEGTRYELETGEHVLGRHPDCQLQLEVGAISRHHAKVTSDSDGLCSLEDLNSRNKTFLNGREVQGRQRLRSGDQLRICDVFLVFRDEREDIDSPSTASSRGSLVVEEEATSTIMSKLDVSSNRGAVHLSASSDAKLSALLEITQSLGKAVTLDEVLPKVLDSLFKIFIQADRGFVILNGKDGELIPRWTKLRREDVDDTLRISRTIVHEVINSKKAVLSADATSDPLFETSQSVSDFRIRSMMLAPLIDNLGEAFGVLQIDTLDQKKRFEQQDLEVLNSVATQAAVAIDNAQLHETTLKQKEMERDLQLAREVQRSFLPEGRPLFENYQFFDYYRPASHVGGDYYDYINLPDGRLAIIVADVVGHGVAAALLMAKLSAEARFSLATESKPAAAITQLNHRFSKLQINRFATLIMVVLDPQTHEITMVNCGHMPPIVRRADGSIEEPGSDCAGIPVGIIEDVQYRQYTTQLAANETVALYTDGLNEAMNSEGKLFGIDRIRKHVKGSREALSKMGQAIVDDVRDYMGSGPQHDDMCLVCFGRTDPGRKTESQLKATL